MQQIPNLSGILNLGRGQDSLNSIRDKPSSIMDKNEQTAYKGANQILLLNRNFENIIYIPAYLRIKVNRVISINYIEARAQIQFQLRTWILLKQLPQDVTNEIIQKASIKINNQSFMLKDLLISEQGLNNGNYIRNISTDVMQFRIGQTMSIDIENNPFWSPFELIKLVAYVHLDKIELKPDFESLDQKNRLIYQKAQVKFNFIDAHSFLQFSFGQLRHLGVFDLAENLVDMEFSKSPHLQAISSLIPTSQDQQSGLLGIDLGAKIINLEYIVNKQKLKNKQIQPQAFSYGRILIPLYKFPGATIVNVFLPFYILSFLSLGVFFEKADMTNRSASIATYQIAFIAFFPTIRASLPETPNIVFAEILVYIQALCAIICFGQSIYHNHDPQYIFIWQQNIPFLICLILTSLNLLTILIMFAIHKFRWQPKYNSLPTGSQQFIKKNWINTDEWWSEQCEKQFKIAIQQDIVKPLFTKRRQKIPQKRKTTMINSQKRKSIKFSNLKQNKI